MVPAIVTASVAVIVAIATQIGTALRARTDRRYASRRAALVDAQDKALAVRLALMRYGKELPKTVTQTDVGASAEVPVHLEEARTVATGEFKVAVSRVEDHVCADAFTRWFELAEQRFIDVTDVSAATESDWFDYVDDLVGAALKNSACKTTRAAVSSITPPALPAAEQAAEVRRWRRGPA